MTCFASNKAGAEANVFGSTLRGKDVPSSVQTNRALFFLPFLLLILVIHGRICRYIFKWRILESLSIFLGTKWIGPKVVVSTKVCKVSRVEV